MALEAPLRCGSAAASSYRVITWGEATRQTREPLCLDWGYVTPGWTDPLAAQEQENEANNFDERGIAA
jgi:hypothetical protein